MILFDNLFDKCSLEIRMNNWHAKWNRTHIKIQPSADIKRNTLFYFIVALDLNTALKTA